MITNEVIDYMQQELKEFEYNYRKVKNLEHAVENLHGQDEALKALLFIARPNAEAEKRLLSICSFAAEQYPRDIMTALKAVQACSEVLADLEKRYSELMEAGNKAREIKEVRKAADAEEIAAEIEDIAAEAEVDRLEQEAAEQGAAEAQPVSEQQEGGKDGKVE